MRAAGTLVHLALMACGSAVVTAIVSLPFLTPAAAMPPLSDTIPEDVVEVAAPRDRVGAKPADRVGARPADPPGRGPGIIRRIDNPDMQVTFTFDACATNKQANGFDRAVLRVLQAEHVPATIFTSGRWVEFHPDAMKELAAEPLIEFANHSYDHPHMARLNSQAIAAELDRTEAALARYGRQSVAFRPPFGDFNRRVLEVARQKHLPAVLWDVVSGDPSAHATAEAMISSVVRETRPGSIIIFHINARETETANALPAIFQQLRTRGFHFVHLSALLARGIPGNPAAARVAAAMTAPVARPVPAPMAPLAPPPPMAAPVARPAVAAPVPRPAVAAPAPPPPVAAPVPRPALAAPVPPAAASRATRRRLEDDDEEVMPPSEGEGISDGKGTGGTSSEASGRQPPLSRARRRRPTPLRAPSLTPAAAMTRAPVTPPPFAPAAAPQLPAVGR